MNPSGYDTVYYWQTTSQERTGGKWISWGADPSLWANLRNVVVAFGLKGIVAVLGRSDIGPPKDPPSALQFSFVEKGPKMAF